MGRVPEGHIFLRRVHKNRSDTGGNQIGQIAAAEGPGGLFPLPNGSAKVQKTSRRSRPAQGGYAAINLSIKKKRRDVLSVARKGLKYYSPYLLYGLMDEGVCTGKRGAPLPQLAKIGVVDAGLREKKRWGL